LLADAPMIVFEAAPDSNCSFRTQGLASGFNRLRTQLGSPFSDSRLLSSLRLWLRGFGFISALAGFLTLIFVVPAIVLGISDRWQVWAGAAFYLVFFTQGTGRRTVKHGEFADRKTDRQVRTGRGKFAAAVTVPGLLAAHWISLLSFSRPFGASTESSSAIENGFGIPFVALLGIGLALLGLFVNFLATRTLGRFFDRLAIKEGHELVTHGIYGLVRHPIYTSYLCLFFSFTLLTGSLAGAIVMAIVSMIWFGSRIPTEEAMLLEAFGEAYQDYMARTRRLIPFVY